MRIWIKIIAKFCFAIMLFTGCELNIGGGGECENPEFNRLMLTRFIAIEKSSDAIVEGDTVLFEVIIADSLVSGFTYYLPKNDMALSCAEVWPGTNVSINNYGCISNSNIVNWIAPEVLHAKQFDFHVGIHNDSLESLTTINAHCGGNDYYEAISFNFDILVLSSDTVSAL